MKNTIVKLTIENDTGSTLQYVDHAFWSGRLMNGYQFTDIPARSKDILTGHESDASLLCGCVGAVKFWHPSMGDIYIGFSAPTLGSKKIGVIVGDASLDEVYSMMNDHYNSPVYIGTEDDGHIKYWNESLSYVNASTVELHDSPKPNIT